jgi:hypothetical protein
MTQYQNTSLKIKLSGICIFSKSGINLLLCVREKKGIYTYNAAETYWALQKQYTTKLYTPHYTPPLKKK